MLGLRCFSLVVVRGCYPSLRCVGFSCCGAQAPGRVGFSSCSPQALGHRLNSCGAHGPSCSEACGIFLDQGSNPCLLHWQVDSTAEPPGKPQHSLLQGISLSLNSPLVWTFELRASLVAQLVKNPPAMQETWVRSLGWEDPLEKRKATHSSILAWRIPCTV